MSAREELTKALLKHHSVGDAIRLVDDFDHECATSHVYSETARVYLTNVIHYLEHGGQLSSVADTVTEALTLHAHELAEQIRAEFSRMTAHMGTAPARHRIMGAGKAADLIDPEVKE